MYIIGFEKIPDIPEVYVEQLDGEKHLYCTSVCIENLPVLKVADLLENATSNYIQPLASDSLRSK